MLYEYECQICQHRTTAIRSLADRKKSPECCGGLMEQRIFTAPRVNYTEFQAYQCVASGEEVTNQAQRDYLMDKNDWAPAEEFGAPDHEQLEEQSARVHESARQEVPAELRESMLREGHSDLL